jgi:D-alanine-D-alanine ligase
VRRLRIGVLYGGRSGEHEVSLASAAAVFAHLDRGRFDPVPIRIERDGRWCLADRPPTAMAAGEVIEHTRLESARPLRSGREVYMIARPGEETVLSIDRTAARTDEAGRALVTGLNLDVIFPVLHGPFGEDGTVQGLLELADVPYVGAGVMASAVGMDKAMMKVVFAAHGLPVCPYRLVRTCDWASDRDGTLRTLEDALGFPMFVKPANLGSSVGITKAKDHGSLSDAIVLAGRFDRRIVVEAAVPDARELECAVIGNDQPQASVVGEVVPSREFYDYEAKYLDSASQVFIPADVPAAVAGEIQRLSLAAFRAIDCAGMARVDFLRSSRTQEVVVNEINTIPGFTTISMFAKLWDATGLGYPALLARLIELAVERHAGKQQLRSGVT